MATIEIDGSYGEGGGQLLRSACSLAAVTGKPCHIFNIRQARREPGLRPQHVLGVRALAQLCGGLLEGDRVGSCDLVFHPKQIVARNLSVKVDTAGSVTLILQALLPAALAAPGPFTVDFQGGGTDTALAPTLDYFRRVFLWFLSRMRVEVEVNLLRRGYYPKGGAALSVEIAPRRPKTFTLTERGSLRRVSLISQAASILRVRRVAERQIEGALNVLGRLPIPPDTTVNYGPSFSPGSSLCIVAEFENTVVGADSLGARGKWAEQVGKDAASDLLREFQSGACLDRHMADQILPYMALAGDSCVTVSEVTSHCRTNMWVIEKFLDGRFEVGGSLIRYTAH